MNLESLLNKGCSNFYFNISHSGVWVVCAISEKEVGIDVEQVKSIDISIAKRFFIEVEYKNLIKQPEEIQLNYFYDLWTLKESYIKQMGKGLSIHLNSFGFVIKDRITIIPNSFPTRYFHQLPLEQNYTLSICSEEEKIENNVKVDINNLTFGVSNL